MDWPQKGAEGAKKQDKRLACLRGNGRGWPRESAGDAKRCSRLYSSLTVMADIDSDPARHYFVHHYFDHPSLVAAEALARDGARLLFPMPGKT